MSMERTLDVDDLDVTATRSEVLNARRVSGHRPAPVQLPPTRAPATTDLDDRSWFGDARCLGADPDVFFPETKRGNNPGTYAAARAICAACPVREQCLTWALDHEERDGVWGGTIDSERKRIGYRRICAVCSNRFPVPKSGCGQRYCSTDCRRISRRETQKAYQDSKRSAAA